MSTELVLYMYQNLEHFGEILMADAGSMMRTGEKTETKKLLEKIEHLIYTD